ncbi:UvrD-helicase domain-containing protein [Glycomyces xiaoerkulensis]|uniref:UvrD-helicase domain-containing protein n=1 Tax=Glycomyces xiaoerkulensis TaxID=2038139 RepID=UPI000C25A287|nr:UvrD-helicase domain-containing protein [Glycomyces xiaoerkulensis]
MRFHADLHIHSKYSRACSKDCDLEHLAWWARRKGITLVGTGDFTHPAWYDHLRESLVPAEPGLFRLREDLDADIVRRLPPNLAERPVRFMLSVEISTIYKHGDRTRKIHHLIYMPDLDSAAEFNRRLAKIGNIASDGRPILGLDSRDLLEIALESGAGGYLVPAHVWTPWFAVLGSKAGFDRIEDCYRDLSDHIFALETGLSSDPAMNWRVSGLDRYRLVSNSDAHSPPMLGRETTLFDTDLDYYAIRRALETGAGHAGSVEFFPEEGKYHVDGHRKCGMRLEPNETRGLGGRCPECGKPVTVGVLSRVEDLADRPEGARADGAADFKSLVPLPEIVSEIVGTGPKSKKVRTEIDRLTAGLGPELSILEDAPVDEVKSHSPLLAEAVARLRDGKVIREAGYDGEYGTVRMFEPGEVATLGAVSVPALFDVEPARPAAKTAPRPRAAPAAPAPAVPAQRAPAPEPTGSPLDGLDPDQRAAAETPSGPLLIVAGPGTGKTRTLTHRIAHAVSTGAADPDRCLAITFTRRAAEEMAERLDALMSDRTGRPTVATFHSLGVRLLREQHRPAGLAADFGIAAADRAAGIAEEAAGDRKLAAKVLAHRSRPAGEAPEPDLAAALERYAARLRELDLVDFADLVALPPRLLEADPDLAAHYRDRYRWIAVDEYQDVDEQQYRLLRALAPPDGDITAIGDPDQAIYRFRGADVGFFLRFRRDFPAARTVELTRNYRSGASIVAGALQVVEPTTLVPGRELRPFGGHGEHRIESYRAASEVDEASFIARRIDQLIGGTSMNSFDSGRVLDDDSGGLGLSDFAVLYRTDRQAQAIMAALDRAGLPFQKRSHDRLADRPGVRELLDELALVPADGPAGPTVADRLRRAAETVLSRTGDAEAETGIRTAAELLKPPAERCGDDLERFRTELVLGLEVDTLDPRADRISLLTLHASKGLEFPVVFIAGCEDGLLPLRHPGEDLDDEAVAEERRLLFVGMTRAQRHLCLTHAAKRSRRGVETAAARSPFLAELSPAVHRRHESEPKRRKPHYQPKLI